jgi:hypothetical protein
MDRNGTALPYVLAYSVSREIYQPHLGSACVYELWGVSTHTCVCMGLIHNIWSRLLNYEIRRHKSMSSFIVSKILRFTVKLFHAENLLRCCPQLETFFAPINIYRTSLEMAADSRAGQTHCPLFSESDRNWDVSTDSELVKFCVSRVASRRQASHGRGHK